jgi:hypothetical protein
MSYYPNIYLEKLKKIIKNLFQNRLSPGRLEHGTSRTRNRRAGEQESRRAGVQEYRCAEGQEGRAETVGVIDYAVDEPSKEVQE